MRPMLATRGSHVPAGDGWVHEVKWDGVRLLADVSRERVRLASRNENDVTPAYPELAGLVGRDLLLDGEVVVLVDGRPSFAALAERMHVRSPRRVAALAESLPVVYLVFDLLRLDGRELTGEPLEHRRGLLEGLRDDGDLAGAHWQVPTTYDDGQMLLQATEEQGLEGVVSKRLSSRYHPGTRSRQWLKFPHRRRVSYVVGGWRPETDSASRLGALLVGEPTSHGLEYRGRVGSGIAGRAGPALRELLAPLRTGASPFVDAVPRIDAQGTTWVTPRVVVDVESLGVSAQGRLRQPAYRGVRDDLDAGDLEEQS